MDPDHFDGHLPPPTFAAIETTMFCNLSCHFCIQYQNGTTVRGPHMEPETFAVIADKLFPHLTSFQPSVSGEPLMSKGLDLVLDKARQMAVRAEYYTNATLLRPKVIERILPTAGKINISFDGATKETYEALRAGAKWDEVIQNIENLVAAARALPEEHRPPIAFACTLMDRNIGELPQLIDLAADLGLDAVGAAHVLPGTEEVQKQSVYHDQGRAAQSIRMAVERARARQLPFSVQPLDQIVAGLAEAEDLNSPMFRNTSDADGVVDALAGVNVLQDRIRPWPDAPPLGSEAEYVRRGEIAPPAPDEVRGALPDSIMVCDFLWSRLYVDHDGGTVPCCVPGVPWLGTLATSSLDEIWNGATERALRVGMAQKNPADCCRGCQHIREVTDPVEISRYLLGKTLPVEPVELPPTLRPITGLPSAYPEDAAEFVEAPTLEWPATEGSEGYVFQVSGDAFRNIDFSTDWHGIVVDEPRFRVPDWAWTHAEPGHVMNWQAYAICPHERPIVAVGAMRRVADVS